MLNRKLYRTTVLLAVLFTALIAGPAAAQVIPATIEITANPTTVSYGDAVPLSITVEAKDEAGRNSEYWVVISAPNGSKWYHNGSGWTQTVSTFGQGPLADFTTVLTTSPMNVPGSYVIECALDFYVNGTKDVGSTYDSVTITVSPQVQVLPQILVTVNGSSNPQVVINDTAAIRLQMDPGTYDNQMAEWWIILVSPTKDKYYYQADGTWHLDDYNLPPNPDPRVYGWNPVVPVDTTIITPNLNLSGSWKVYFGLDDKSDNQVNMVVRGSASISVPGTLPTIGLNWTPGWPTSPQKWPGTVGTPLNAEMILNLTDGTYSNLDAELWLLCVAPSGNEQYFSAGMWDVVKAPIDQDKMGLLAGFFNGMTILTPNMDEYGTWTIYALVDNIQNNQLDTGYFIYDRLAFKVGTNPDVDVTVIKSPWSMSGDLPGDLAMHAYVYPGSYGARAADFWVVVVSPVGVYSSLKLVDGWVPGTDYWTQGIIDNVKDRTVGTPPDPADPSQNHENWNLLTINLYDQLRTMTGTWTVYFGMDTLNGYLDQAVVYDVDTIRITP